MKHGKKSLPLKKEKKKRSHLLLFFLRDQLRKVIIPNRSLSKQRKKVSTF